MCTAIVSIDPQSAVPVLLVGVRDEFLDRPWRAPGRYWPRWPELVGGQDLEAGGTWLAVHPGVPRVATVLNGRGSRAEPSRRRSRGELPLLLAADGELGDLDPTGYDPFHLVCATAGGTRLWTWNGEKLAERTLEPGLHLIVNSGLEAADSDADSDSDAVGRDQASTIVSSVVEGSVVEGSVIENPGADDSGPDASDSDDENLARMRARVAYLRPLLTRAHRPEPRSGDARTAWGAWFSYALGGLDTADPRALVVRAAAAGRRWGTSSVSLVALTRDGARYDFCPDPTATAPTWMPVIS